MIVIVFSGNVAGSTDTTRLRSGVRSSQSDLSSVNGDVAMTTVADDNKDRDEAVYGSVPSHTRWRRIVLLIVAITVHNIPGSHLYLFIYLFTMVMFSVNQSINYNRGS